MSYSNNWKVTAIMQSDFYDFMPCSVDSCGIKVKKREPILDCSTFVDQENLLISLHTDEIKEMGDDQLSNSPTTSYVRKGKPVYGSIGTTGYNPLRSDFETEYDNNAEMLLGGRECPMETMPTLEKEDHALIEALQCSIISMYNIQLKEREWRKQIIRNHALIESKKLYTLQQRLEQAPFGRTNPLVLLKFMRFLRGPELDFIIEGVMLQISLKQRLASYMNHRGHGIRFKSGIKVFENLYRTHHLNSNDNFYQNIALSSEIVGAPRAGRKLSTPLVLHNLPGYNLLDENEKQLCSTVRIVPETYHNFKQLLINECKKNDGLKLATARQVIKIDVNKTRKMYDLLKHKGLVWLPNS